MAEFSDIQHGKKCLFRKPEYEDQGSYLPTPAKIERECLKIQAGWSDETRANRDQYPVDPVTVARSYESNLGKSGVCRRGYNVEGKS